MAVPALVQWVNGLGVSAAIRDSLWLFPVIEAVHLLALGLLGGTTLLVDLRLLGWGLRDQPVDDMGHAARPWMLVSLVAIIVSGVALAASEAIKCYESAPFRIKIAALAVALLFTFTVRRPVVESPLGVSVSSQRLVGATSIALWLTVGLAGRAIGFY